MATTQEQIQMFGYLLPGLSESNKRPPATPQQQNNKGDESGKDGGKRRRTRRGQGGQGSRNSAPAEALTKDGGRLLNLISRILLQHEDSINAAKMDRGFTVFMAQTGPAGLLTSLYKASIAWNQIKDNEPAKITQPLRITLLTLMIAELKVRLQNLEKKQEAKQLAISAGWLDQQDRLLYQKWDAENAKLVPHPTMPGLLTTEVMQTLTEIEPLILESLVLRFHAPRKIKHTQETENKAVFKLEVSLRSTEADQLYQSLAKLENNAAWQLIGCQLRKDGMRRSNPVQELMKLLSQGGSTCWGGDNHMCNTMWLSLHHICFVDGVYQHLQPMQDSRLLILDPDTGLQTPILQETITSWHGVIAVQALIEAPQMLWLQLPRFVQTGARVQKAKQSISLDVQHRCIRIPVFASTDASRDDSIKWCDYRVNAVIYHLGATVSAGHYRTMLFHPQANGGWHTDDGKPAAWCKAVPKQVERNCYLVCATRLVSSEGL
ncbi:unnamed protein product [Symbiodinium sp. CCMP2592]|nr:unnamed protein product [Symbiodinium sp. CCMP2592]